MSKTFDTKERILKLLNKKPRTVTQIAQALGLAQSTVSQHMDELMQTGAVDEFDDSKRKWRYYKVNPEYYSKISKSHRYGSGEYSVAKKVLAAAIVLIVVAVAAFSLYHKAIGTNNNSISSNITVTTIRATTTIEATTTISAKVIPAFSASACPIIFANQTFNTTLVNYLNMSYYNYSNMRQFVLAPGSSGTLYLKITKPASSTSITIDNFAEFFYDLTNNTNLSSSRQIKIAFNQTNNLAISFNRSSEILTNLNPEAKLKVAISANTNATPGTYMVILPEGPCKPNGASMLLTVGNVPYNGTVAPVIIA